MREVIHVLIVVEDATTRDTLHAALASVGYAVCSVSDASTALARLAAAPVDVVVVAVDETGSDAPRLCSNIRQAAATRPIYILKLVSEALGSTGDGHWPEADDTLAWPAGTEELLCRVSVGARLVSSQRRVAETAQTYRQQTISLLSRLLEVYNADLAAHCRRVAGISLRLARRHPDIPEKAHRTLETAARLHDIGMVTLPYALLFKRRTERTSDEQFLFQSHPCRGESILSQAGFLKPTARLVRWHHEQFNGRGFPDGLKGKKIPLLARILSAASIYDNLQHRGRVALDAVWEKLQQFNGYQLEPDIVELLFDILKEDIQHEAKQRFRELRFDELENGMTIAQSVRMKTGAVAIPMDTDLNADLIEKIENYVSSECIGDKFYVYK
jgi:response regulator RpfG family c-di-GMP phosphodiesterase